MRHILYKAKAIKITWGIAKVYSPSGGYELARHLQGTQSVQLTADDFRRLANDMDRAGLKTIRIVSARSNLYIGLNE